MELGDKAMDVVTGVEGIIVARAVYLNGCERIAIQARAKKGEASPDYEWVDIHQIKVMKKQVFKAAKNKNVSNGGPAKNDAPRF